MPAMGEKGIVGNGNGRNTNRMSTVKYLLHVLQLSFRKYRHAC